MMMLHMLMSLQTIARTKVMQPLRRSIWYLSALTDPTIAADYS
jgi:hypothetical protein